MEEMKNNMQTNLSFLGAVCLKGMKNQPGNQHRLESIDWFSIISKSHDKIEIRLHKIQMFQNETHVQLHTKKVDWLVPLTEAGRCVRVGLIRYLLSDNRNDDHWQQEQQLRVRLRSLIGDHR